MGSPEVLPIVVGFDRAVDAQTSELKSADAITPGTFPFDLTPIRASPQAQRSSFYHSLLFLRREILSTCATKLGAIRPGESAPSWRCTRPRLLRGTGGGSCGACSTILRASCHRLDSRSAESTHRPVLRRCCARNARCCSGLILCLLKIADQTEHRA